MKKKILTLVAMATLVTMMTACGNSETVDNTTTPTTAPTVTVEPTEAPEVTVEPTEVPTVTVEPTEAPEVTPTETPVEPTVAPTEAPEVTVEPTVAPTEAPAEPTEAPSVDVAEDPNFQMMKGWTDATKTDYMARHTYVEYASIIETMDESRYVVTAVEGLDPVLKVELADKQSVVDTFLSHSDLQCYEIQRTNKFGKTNTVTYEATPTGEMYTMTLTDTVTGETFVWGFRVHVEAKDEPGTYYVHELNVSFISHMQGTLGTSFVTDNFTEDYQFQY